MRGQNRVLGDGPIRRLPLIIGLVISAAVLSSLFILGPSRVNRAHDDTTRSKTTKEFNAMLELGEGVIRKDNELRLEREKRARGPQNDELTADELREKAKALSEEARQASEYADSLEGIERPADSRPEFEDSYRAYTGMRQPSPPKAEPADKLREAKIKAFNEALKSPSRIKINKSAERREQKRAVALQAEEYIKNYKENEKPYRTLSDYMLLDNSIDGFVLDSEVEGMKTPWCVRQGSVIPAVLLTPINSDQPGLVSAQVPSDVLDSVNGRDVLIPAGTIATGQYGSRPGNGDRRLFIAFTRLMFPDGSSIAIGSMPGQDSQGAGLTSHVETHFFTMLTSAFLVSAISAPSAAYSDTSSYAKAVGSSASSNLGSSLSRILDNNVNLSPTLSVQAGYSFYIAVTKDIYFNGPYGTKDFSK
jgi:type IV secretory pathway VirB10-like protein